MAIIVSPPNRRETGGSDGSLYTKGEEEVPPRGGDDTMTKEASPDTELMTARRELA